MKNMCKNMAKNLVESMILPTFVLPKMDNQSDCLHIFSDCANLAYPREFNLSYGLSVFGEIKGVRSLCIYTILNKTFNSIMPKTENVLRRVHSAPKASVLPTTQASILPTRWSKVSYSKITNQLSDTPDFYTVMICGEEYNHTSEQVREVEVQQVFTALNPLMAVGYAVLNFLNRSRAIISDIQIFKGNH